MTEKLLKATKNPKHSLKNIGDCNFETIIIIIGIIMMMGDNKEETACI